jgi:Zn finger protein HypA/HybF involved in hydrogenase expression
MPPISGLRFENGLINSSTSFGHEARTAKVFMPEGYCVKCKAKKEIADGVEETMKNGRKAIKGKCPTCGTVMFKILGGKSAPAAAPAPSPVNPQTS